MDDQEIAVFIRDQLRRRLSGPDLALVESIADGHEMTTTDRRRLEHLKTQHAAELGHAGKAATR